MERWQREEDDHGQEKATEVLMGRASRRRRERRIQKRRELATTVHDWTPKDLGIGKRRNTEEQHGETGSNETR